MRATTASGYGSVLLFNNGALVEEIDAAEMPLGPLEIVVNPNWKVLVDSVHCYCWLVAVAVDGGNNVLWVQVGPPHARWSHHRVSRIALEAAWVAVFCLALAVARG